METTPAPVTPGVTHLPVTQEAMLECLEYLTAGYRAYCRDRGYALGGSDARLAGQAAGLALAAHCITGPDRLCAIPQGTLADVARRLALWLQPAPTE